MFKKTALSVLLSCAFSVNAHVLSQKELDKAYQTPESAARQLVAEMSLREKIGQLIMLDFRYWGMDQNNEPKLVVNVNDQIQKVISDYELGNVILFRENLYNTEQTINFIQDLQDSRTNLPLFIATDQEGGYVTRLREGTEMPGNMAVAATRDSQLAKKSGQVHGLELSALGINFNFGPVVDVNTEQRNPIIGVRSYSSDLTLIDEMGSAYIEGLSEYGVLNSVKHFPGHGNVEVDSHYGLATVPYTREEWEAVDLQAFKNIFKSGADSVMTAHVIVPSVDDAKLTSPLTGEVIGTPATLSKKILTGVLREELKFNGLILTDALDMGAIANNFEPSWTVEHALLAGADITLMPLRVWSQEAVSDLEKIYSHLETQSKSNPELAKRIDQSALRVVTKKLSEKISAQPVDKEHAEKVVQSAANKSAESHIAERSITLIENQSVLPFKLKNKTRILVISDESARNNLIAGEIALISEKFKGIDISVEKIALKMIENNLQENKFKQSVENADYVIAATYNLTGSSPNAQKLIDITNQQGKPTVVISSRNPYDIAYLEGVKANIAIYGITGFDVTNNNRNSLEANIRAGVRTLFLDPMTNLPINSPSGKLPVDIKHKESNKVIYPIGLGLTY
ncbi:glycoside hydrolase family 3 protein [Psychromonas ossibalaenae]|uniref:glycoside hydrolase family 3 protein n=1 Tax=Psychromonas ossibalaenae TaxID=444922 RepID=UPI00037B0DAD|nr:glycoside hydrolase family 3 protein [Psychromonas ossibalaenae]